MTHEVSAVGADLGPLELEPIHHVPRASVETPRGHDDGHALPTQRSDGLPIPIVNRSVSTDERAVEIDREQAWLGG
jgi:hypothetical protein